MREPRTEVTCRVDRIACSTTEGKTDRCNEEADDERVQPFCKIIRPDEEKSHHQDERADDLTREVGNIVLVCVPCREHAEFRTFILFSLEMRHEVQPDDCGPQKTACNLSNNVRDDLSPFKIPCNRKTECHSRVDVSA